MGTQPVNWPELMFVPDPDNSEPAQRVHPLPHLSPRINPCSKHPEARFSKVGMPVSTKQTLPIRFWCSHPSVGRLRSCSRSSCQFSHTRAPRVSHSCGIHDADCLKKESLLGRLYYEECPRGAITVRPPHTFTVLGFLQAWAQAASPHLGLPLCDWRSILHLHRLFDLHIPFVALLLANRRNLGRLLVKRKRKKKGGG